MDMNERPEPMPHGGYLALGMRTWEATGARDPLEGMDEEALRLLYDNARADLLRTVGPATAALLRRGKCGQMVVGRMRAMAWAGGEGARRVTCRPRR